MSKPSVKQHLAAIRMLFDWLVTGQVVPINPAHAVRGPKHSVRKGKTSVLSADEMGQLLSSIDISKLIGLRDRALIAVMGYTFARVGAAVALKVEDYYIQKRRGWLRLHEKGGKVNELPCHHNLEQFLDEWLSASGLANQPDAPLFPGMKFGKLMMPHVPLHRPTCHRMIHHRALAAGIRIKVSAHSFRASGISTYLRNGGKLEVAQQLRLRILAQTAASTTSITILRRSTISRELRIEKTTAHYSQESDPMLHPKASTSCQFACKVWPVSVI